MDIDPPHTEPPRSPQTEAETRARLERMEVRLAHHERAIEELNEVVTRQADLIDALTVQLRRMGEHLDEIEEMSRAPAPVTRPPHY